MVPQAESSSASSLHCGIDEHVLKHNEGQEKVDIADLVPNSEEVGTWYYVVDCATCKAVIPFKHAPEGEPILCFPTMRVRCFHCRTVHAYAADLVSHRKALAPRGIFKIDQPADARDGAAAASRYRQQDRGVGDWGGREIVECKIDPDNSLMRRGNSVIAAVCGKRATMFFLSSCFFATGWVLQLALNVFYPVTLAVRHELRSYGPAVLLGSAYSGTVLFGLALFIFGMGSFLVDTYGFKRNALRKDVLVLLTRNAFLRFLTTGIKPAAKMASLTSLARQASRALSTIVSGTTTFRSLIKRSATLR